MFVLNLVPVAKVRCRDFILGQDADERIALELWKFLHNEYTATNGQAIQNFRNQINDLKNIDGQKLESHFDKFNGLAEKQASFGFNLLDKKAKWH